MSLRVTLRKPLPHFRLDVSFDCAPGETLALVGPSGSGKTTVLRCLAGLETMDGGAIHFESDCWNRDAKLLATPQSRGVGLLSQDAPLFPTMTIFGNVCFAAPNGGGRGIEKEALALLESTGIDHLRDRKPHEVSGGERQRAALCQVLMRRPRLLLLDEPFSALDMENRLALRARLLEIREEHAMPMILVTHDLADAMAMADRVISLRLGREDHSWLRNQLHLLNALHADLAHRDKAPAWRFHITTAAQAASQ